MGQPIVAIGTYTGTRPNSGGSPDSSADDLFRIALGFTPDLVIVIPENANYPGFKSRYSWHGKTQFFDSVSSANLIGPYVGGTHLPFIGNGFSVRDTFNVQGATYHYIAIKDNGSGLYSGTKWIGNATNNRSIEYRDNAPEVAWVKRDGGTLSNVLRPSVFKTADNNAILGHFFPDHEGQATELAGTGTQIASLDADGITISNAVQVNENAGGSGLGEGIEVVSLKGYNAVFEVVEYDGDGTGDRTISCSFTPEAAIILDATNDTNSAAQHCLLTDSMATDESKAFNNDALDTTGHVVGIVSGGVRVSASYNTDTQPYTILAFKSNAAAVDTETVRGGPKAVRLTRGSGRINLADNTLGTDPYTLNIWCRIPEFEDDFNNFIPLLMLGDGAEDADDAYNGGIYLAKHDPDGNTWEGYVIRHLQFQELFILRDGDEDNINLYNVNTGIAVAPGSDVHITVVYDGADNFYTYLDGHRVNAFEPTTGQLSGRTTGGTGGALDTVIGALLNTTYSDQAGIEVYAARILQDTALTSAQAKSLYRSDLYGTVYNGPAFDIEANFTTNGTASGATISNGTVIDRITEPSHPTDSLFVNLEQSGINTSSYTGTGQIPSAGTWIVGVQFVSASGATLTGITMDGETPTLLDSSSGITEVETHWYAVTTDSAGDIAITWNTNVIFAAICVYDASNLDIGGTIYGSEAYANTSTALTATISSMPRGYRVFGMVLLNAIGGAGRASVDDWHDLKGGCWIDEYTDVGSTSRGVCGSFISTGQAEFSARHEHASTQKAGLSILGVGDNAATTTSILPVSRGVLRVAGRTGIPRQR